MKSYAEGLGFGRICLWGDHCDWAHQQVIASSIDRRVLTRCRPREDGLVSITAENTVNGTVDEAIFSMQEAASLPLRGHSLKYVNAVVVALQERFSDLGGVDISITSNVPMRKGLSSSAALCVSTTRALSSLWELDLPSDEVVRVSYRAERDILGIGCGMMDQTASAFEYPLFMDFSEDFFYERVDLRRELPIVIGDVGGERDTKLILNTLNKRFEERDPLIVRTLERDIPRIVALARSEMEGKCRLEALGELMNRNQECYDRGLRPFCEDELGSPLLYRALESAREGGALGAKWTGAGGAGSVIALAANMDAREELTRAMRKSCRSTILASVSPDRTVSI